MSVSILIPANLRQFSEQRSKIEVSGNDVASALSELCQSHPLLRDKLLSADNRLHSFINIFVDGRAIRDLDGLATPLNDGSSLLIVPALAGG